MTTQREATEELFDRLYDTFEAVALAKFASGEDSTNYYNAKKLCLDCLQHNALVCDPDPGRKAEMEKLRGNG